MADDADSLQAAIDHAQAHRAVLHVPAGVYLVNRTLRVRDNSGVANTTWKNCSFSVGKTSDYVQGNTFVSCPAALRMVGDGGWGMQTMIRAGAAMDAVIEVESATDVTGNTGYAHSHEFAEFAIVADGKAFWGLRGRAIIRSRVVGLHVSGAVNTCIELSQGFINRVEDCDVQGCSLGIVASNEAASVVIANNNLEGQSMAGIVVGSGSNILIVGNEFEGCAPSVARRVPPQ